MTHSEQRTRPLERASSSMTKYSILISHYNNVETIRQSLESILAQTDDSFEVVIVDNYSTDGSGRILEEYSARKKVRVVRQKCSRGKARQIALENSSGAYALSNFDLDDVFKPRLIQLLQKYHSVCDGDLLWVRSVDKRGFWGGENFTIAPRKLLQALGGWRDLQIGEDWELARRASRAGRYRWSYFQLLESTNPHPERRTLLGRVRFRYLRYRDMLRVGRALFKKGDHISIAQRLPFLVTKLTLPFYEKYQDEGTSRFEPNDEAFYVNLGEDATGEPK